MFKIENKNIFLNRGDQMVLRLSVDQPFSIGDIIKFSIMKENDCTKVIFQKEFTIEEEANYYDILLTSEETKIGEYQKNKAIVYWYEIELNGIDTLIGFDDDGPKLFTLWPEAPEKEV